MTNFKQNDPRWKNIEYAPGCTFGSFGCFLTSLGNLKDLTPPECASKIKSCISSTGMLLNPQKIAELLGLEYNGISTTKPDYDCIAETTYWDKPSTNQIEQHFFIVKADGTQQDPLGLKTNYPIKTYRLFKGEMNMTYELFRQKGTAGVYERLNNYALVGIPNPEFAVKYYGNNWGLKVQEVDDLNAIGWIAEDPRPLKQTIVNLKNDICKLNEQPPKIEIKEVPVEKEVIKYVDKPVDKIVEKEVIVQPKTVGEALLILWETIFPSKKS